jgi:LPS sulfotransferase NodH
MPGALGSARAAARLAVELGEPTRLKRTATILEKLGGAPTIVARMRKLSEAARKKNSHTIKNGEPSSLFEAVGIAPETARQIIFKYLDYASGPNGLRNVRNKALIACTSRTGSTLLCAQLQMLGIDAQEYFNLELAVRDASFAGDAHTIREYADNLAKTAVLNKWFVTKGALETFLFLCYLGEFPEHSAEWKFVYLRRRNLIRQSISMEIASRTQQWHARLLPRDVIGPADYSFESLWKHMQYILSANAQWERVFTLLGISPHRVLFEDFVADASTEMRSVAKYLGVSTAKPSAAKPAVLLPLSQSTSLNDHWERRFRQELSNRLNVRTELASR